MAENYAQRMALSIRSTLAWAATGAQHRQQKRWLQINATDPDRKGR
jgi:hypothetical protein